MLTISLVLALLALLLTVAHAMNKAPLWIAVVILAILELIQAAMPLR